MSEIWKDIYFEEKKIIYDYRGLYQVSNYGRVKTLERKDSMGRIVKEKIMKQSKCAGDYLRVQLCKNGESKFFLVHRIVGFMFIDGYFEDAHIDHIDTNRSNNHVDNLRWCTIKENHNNPLTKEHISKSLKGKKRPEHSEKLKGRQRTTETRKKIGKSHRGKPKGKLIERWDKKGNLIDIKYQFEYVAMGFTQSAISFCCTGRYKSHKGFIFKYHEE